MSAPHELKRWTCPHCDYELPAGDVGAQRWHMEQHREQQRLSFGVDRTEEGDVSHVTLLRLRSDGTVEVLASAPLDQVCAAFDIHGVAGQPEWTRLCTSCMRMPDSKGRCDCSHVEEQVADLTDYRTEGATGVKRDAGKPDLSFLPTEALVGAARVFAFGARKYARDNWRGGMPWTQPYAAVLRHLTAWLEGEDLDQDSGLPHLDHALCTLMMLRWFTAHRADLDNRFKGEAPVVDLTEVEE